MSDRELIDEQIPYYRARAAEYDATSTPGGDPFAVNGEAIRAALRSFEPRGRVLELAAGTGQWTTILAEYADELTVTDASPEMLTLNAGRLGEGVAEYRVVDVFALEASHAYDVVVFGFFLSHVPHGRFDAFWNVLEGQLGPRGRVFFIDEASHGLWEEDWVDEGTGIVRRTLRDGSVHRAVKVLWRPSRLEERLHGLGWNASVHPEGPFYWGSATR